MHVNKIVFNALPFLLKTFKNYTQRQVIVFVNFCLIQNGTEDVKSHKWFKVIDWNLVYQRKLKVRVLVSPQNDGCIVVV